MKRNSAYRCFGFIVLAMSSLVFSACNPKISRSAPTISSVSPNLATSAGGTRVTITGSNFYTGATANFGSTACLAPVVNSTNSMSCTTPAGSSGSTVNVTVYTSEGNATLGGAFSYIDPPTVTVIAPVSGTSIGGTSVTLTGTNFTSGSTVSIGGVNCSSVSVLSSTSLTCTTGVGAVGASDVVVTNPAGSGTLAAGYTYIFVPTLSLPTISAITPSTGTDGGTSTITITGTNFFFVGVTVTVNGTACASLVVNSTTSLTCTVPVYGGLAVDTTAAVDVVVSNTVGSVTATGGFTYVKAPTITSISPATGTTAGGTILTITGHNFYTGMTVTVDGVTCASPTVVNVNTLTCTVPAGTSGVAKNIVVTNSNTSPTSAVTDASAYNYTAWTYTLGSSATGAKGVDAGKGVTAASNLPGGRSGAVTWTDSSNNLWLFGGYGLDTAGSFGYQNDLWKFDSTTKQQWTWMKGSDTNAAAAATYGVITVADVANTPGVRAGAVSWVDSTNKLWLFGGYGQDFAGTYGYLNDLWNYDSAVTTWWTWQKGAKTVGTIGVYGGATGVPGGAPGARFSAVSWVDATDKLWLFGGYGYDSVGTLGYLNDLWVYDTGTDQWTWMAGSNTVGTSGVYGTQGVAAASNTPGSRYGAVAWYDANILWLFGGSGFDSTSSFGNLNDLWKYDTAGAKQWIWVTGSTTIGASGVYGVRGTSAATNTPGARNGAVAWKDSNHNLWLLGGTGVSASGVTGYLNDLWEFDISGAASWAWVSGSSASGIKGTYGTQQEIASANTPGARYGGASWLDSTNRLWLLGGNGFGASGAAGYLNDLWNYGKTGWTTIATVSAVDLGGGVMGGSHVGGNTVTITGTNFITGTTVTIGGVSCTPVTITSLTSLTCTAGADLSGGSATPVAVVVTNGNSATKTAAYTYVPLPTYASVAPASINNTTHADITITGTGFVTGTTLTVGGAACQPGTYVINSSTSLSCQTALLPATAAPGAVIQITNAAGSTSSSVGTPGLTVM